MRITDSPVGLPSLLDEYNLFEFSNPLLPHHRELLALAGIAPDIADARGVISVTTPAELRRKGFSAKQAAVAEAGPVLVFCLWGTDGQLRSVEMRPDVPRVSESGSPPL